MTELQPENLQFFHAEDRGPKSHRGGDVVFRGGFT